MPCRDVTELIHVEIDAEDRLRTYRFVKRTCGRGVGADSLLEDRLRGRSVEALLAMDAAQALAEFSAATDLEEFLHLKHFFAVQAALEALTGRQPAGPGALCAVAGIAYDADGSVSVDAEIAVDVVTEQIKACGACKGCGVKKPEKVVFP